MTKPEKPKANRLIEQKNRKEKEKREGKTQLPTNFSVGICTICKVGCHSDHDVIGPFFSLFFCDCGARPSCSSRINPVNISNSECTFYIFINLFITNSIL